MMVIYLEIKWQLKNKTMEVETGQTWICLVTPKIKKNMFQSFKNLKKYWYCLLLNKANRRKVDQKFTEGLLKIHSKVFVQNWKSLIRLLNILVALIFSSTKIPLVYQSKASKTNSHFQLLGKQIKEHFLAQQIRKTQSKSLLSSHLASKQQ